MTGQTNIDFKQVWKEVEEVDERLLLNDIMPRGVHGEKWSNNVTRAALTKYHNDVEQYIQKKLVPPPHVWGGYTATDIRVSPAPSSTGGSTSIELDGDDDDDDDQTDHVFKDKEPDGSAIDGNNDDDTTVSSSASDHPRDNCEEGQEEP